MLVKVIDFKLVFIVGLIGLFIAILLSPKINILNLGDDVAIAFNMNCCHLFDADTQLSYTYKEQK